MISVDENRLITLLNCAEADLIGFLEEMMIDASDPGEDAPAAMTVREIHAYLKEIEDGHKCSLDVEANNEIG